MLLLNHTQTNMDVLKFVPGAMELIKEIGKEAVETLKDQHGIIEYELFGIQFLIGKKWMETKNIHNPYWYKDKMRESLSFILDGKKGDVCDFYEADLKAQWTDDRTMEIYETSDGRMDIQMTIIMGIGDIPVKSQRYLLYLLSKMVSFPEEVTRNDIDHLEIFYKRFRDQYLAA